MHFGQGIDVQQNITFRHMSYAKNSEIIHESIKATIYILYITAKNGH